MTFSEEVGEEFHMPYSINVHHTELLEQIIRKLRKYFFFLISRMFDRMKERFLIAFYSLLD